MASNPLRIYPGVCAVTILCVWFFGIASGKWLDFYINHLTTAQLELCLAQNEAQRAEEAAIEDGFPSRIQCVRVDYNDDGSAWFGDGCEEASDGE